MKPLPTLLLGAALLCGAALLLAAEHVYYVGLDIRLAGQDRGTFGQRSPATDRRCWIWIRRWATNARCWHCWTAASS